MVVIGLDWDECASSWIVNEMLILCSDILLWDWLLLLWWWGLLLRWRRMHLCIHIPSWGLLGSSSRGGGGGSILGWHRHTIAGSISSNRHVTLQFSRRRSIVVVHGSVGGVSDRWNLRLGWLRLPTSAAAVIGLVIVGEHSAGRIRGGDAGDSHVGDRHLWRRLHVSPNYRLHRLIGDPHLGEVILNGNLRGESAIRRAILGPHPYRR